MAESGELGKNLPLDTVKRACKIAFRAHKTPENGPLYVVDKKGQDAIFAFAGCWSAGEWFAAADGAGPFGEAMIDLSQFPCLRSISNDEHAKVNRSFLVKFMLLKTTLWKEVTKAVKEGKRIIFTGHSSGGAIAIFATVTLFEELRLSANIHETSHNCITFGSPLIADRIFCHAIRRENWSDHFVHFVMRYDIVPRVPLAPPSSIGNALNDVLSFFNPNSRVPKTFPSVASEFFVNVMRNASCAATHAACTLMGSTNMMVDTISAFIELSPYRPFGTFVFCSGDGAMFAVKNPDAVLQLLFYTLQLDSESEGPKVAEASINTHLAYEAEINQNLGRQNQVYFEEFGEIPLKTDVSIDSKFLVLDKFGLSARARLCLRAARESEKQKINNQSKTKEKRGQMEEAFAKLEEYRSSCETRGGYYDAFRQNKYENDFKANIRRLELAGLWDEIVEMLKRYELPESFEGELEWVVLGTRYRRLAEPLDIGNYYRHSKNEDTGPYIQKGRPRRYRYTQRWLEHFEKKPSGSRAESILWAEVEELRIRTSSGDTPFAVIRPKVEEMMENLKKWLREGAVEMGAFSEGSSLVNLWTDLRRQYNEVPDIMGLITP